MKTKLKTSIKRIPGDSGLVKFSLSFDAKEVGEERSKLIWTAIAGVLEELCSDEDLADLMKQLEASKKRAAS